MREILFWGPRQRGATMVGGERKIFENVKPLDRWNYIKQNHIKLY